MAAMVEPAPVPNAMDTHASHGPIQAGEEPAAKENGLAEEPAPERLDVRVPQPQMQHLASQVAHLAWEPPVYHNARSGRELPPLNVLSYQIFWAEATIRPGGVMQAIADEDWHPLPSGDVSVPAVQVGGLRPGKSYAVRVACTLDLQHVDPRLWQLHVLPSPPRAFITVPTVPSPVKPPLLVAKDRKFLKVKWNVPDEPGGENMPLSYQLFMAPPPTGWTGAPNQQGYVEVYHGPERTCKVVKLVPGARYSFWVLARNSVGYSEPGQMAHYTTQATVPAQPSPPRPVSATQSSITLQWVAPAGNGAAVTNYVLERDEGVPTAALAQAPGGLLPQPAFQLAYAGPLQTVMVGGLRSGLSYRFRLRAENDEGASFWSDPCIATPAASAPGAPASVVITAITQQSATVSWAGPLEDGGAPVLTHEVELQAMSHHAAESMGRDWLCIFQGCSSGCTISSLQPGCTYRVRVRCANSAGWGSWCMPVDLTTAPDVPGAPGAPVIAQAGTTSLTLTWQHPRHNGGQRITTFLVELLPPGPKTYMGPDLPRVSPQQAAAAAQPASVPGAILVYRGEEPPAQITGLLPGVMYQFRVQASNSLGVGPWGEWSTLGTAPDCPSAPMPPCLSSPATSSSLRVSWQAPDAQGSPIQGYVLQAAVQGAISSSGQLVPQACAQPLPQLPPRSDSVPHLLGLLQQQQGQPTDPNGGGGGGNGGGGGGDTPAPAAAAAASEPTERLERAPSTASKTGPWQQVYKGSGLSTEVGSLQPCTRYLLKVAAFNQVGLGSWSPIAAVTTAPAPPSLPQGVEAQPQSASDVEVRWQPPAADNGSQITGYVVDVAPAGASSSSGSAAATPGGAGGMARSGSATFSGTSGTAGAWQQAASVGATQQGVVVSSLLPGRMYLFRVRALNAVGSSPSCTPVSACTHAAPPSAPQRLAVTQRAATHAKVKWDEPAASHGATVTSYLLELAQVDAGSSCSPAAGVAAPACEQQPLQEQGEAAAAAAAAPAGEARAQDTQQQQQEVATQGERTSQNCSSSGGGEPSEAGWVEVYQGADTTARVADLQPGCRYALRVRARNTAGWGPTCPCEPFTTALAPPGPPEGVSACLVPAAGDEGLEDGHHNVLLRWLPPAPHPAHALVASYELHARPLGGSGSGAGREVRKVVGKATECVVEELQPGQRYALRVRAAGMEGAGHGGWSDSVEMVMPGHSRGVTDSADSMSAASGNNDAVMAPLGAAGHKAAAAALEKGVGRRLNGVASGRSARQQAKRQPSGSHAAPVGSTYSETEDAVSVVSGVIGGAAALTNGSHKISGNGSGGTSIRTRINTTKLLGAAAVQKRPRAGFLATLLSKEVLSPAGARRAYKSSCRSAKKLLARHKWRLAAVLLVAFVAWMLRWAVLRVMGGPVHGRGRAAQYF